MKNTWRFLVIVVLIASAALVGCGTKTTPTATATSAAVASVTPASIVTAAAPQTVSRSIRLDPATVQDADSLAVSSLVYDNLVRLDASGNPQPALALSWTISDDQLDYILVLRQGVTFSSGAPFNADAVLTNFNRWFDPADALHGSQAFPGWTNVFLGFKGDVDAQGVAVSFFDGIEKVDEHTVLIHLNRPEPKLLQFLAQPSFAMLDPTVLASKGATVGSAADGVSGTGAYRISTWTDAGLALAPNSGYWGEVPAGPLTIGWK